MPDNLRSLLALPLVLFFVAISGCSGAPEMPQEQPLPVTVITVSEQAVPNIVELPGRVEAVRVAEVRARVNGIVQSRVYEEGEDVRRGQVLFRIDPRELRASFNQFNASLERSKATAANARAVVNRYKPLVAEQAISQQEYDAAVAAAREAEATVAEAQAQLDAARLQLNYTTVRAPLSGRARRAEVTEGALVSAAEATLLTRIEQRSRVYVTFAQSSAAVMKIRRGIADGTIEIDENQAAEVRLTFEDGTPYALPGFIDFLDFSVNETTGTVDLRARFPNPQDVLLPGEFVRAQIFVGEKQGGIIVPQRAVQITEQGASVFVVDADGQAQVKPVVLGPMINGDWIIESGLSNGDRVITSNLQRLRPGTPVSIQAPQSGARPSDASTSAGGTRTPASRADQ